MLHQNFTIYYIRKCSFAAMSCEFHWGLLVQKTRRSSRLEDKKVFSFRRQEGLLVQKTKRSSRLENEKILSFTRREGLLVQRTRRSSFRRLEGGTRGSSHRRIEGFLTKDQNVFSQKDRGSSHRRIQNTRWLSQRTPERLFAKEQRVASFKTQKTRRWSSRRRAEDDILVSEETECGLLVVDKRVVFS